MAALFRYDLDITGLNPDNLVIGELHVMSDNRYRAVTPTYGPFFTESLKVYDNATGNELVRGQHFQCLELLQDATVHYGKEICSIILMIDPAVSPDIRVNYQVLGGYYINDSSAVANMYETILKDTRPIAWENVIDRPSEYPPTLHRHLMDDVYGFEAIVAALERVRNAILLSDVPAFEALLEYIEDRLEAMNCQESLTIYPVRKIVTYDRMLVTMSKLGLLSDYKLVHVPAVIYREQPNIFYIDAPSAANGTPVYWQIVHISTTDADFSTLQGVAYMNAGRASFNIQPIANPLVEDENQFFIILKNSPTATDCLYLTCSTKVNAPVEPYKLHDSWDLYRDPDVHRSSVNMMSAFRQYLSFDKFQAMQVYPSMQF